LVVADLSGRSVRLFYGNGNGTFGGAIVYPVGSNPTSIVTGDFNGDSAQDVAVALNAATALPVFYNQGGTRITETASTTSPAFGQAVTFHATLTPSIAGNSTPTGTVSFKQGSTVLGTVALSGAKGSFTTSTLSKGSHTVVAVYNGSALQSTHQRRSDVDGAVTTSVSPVTGSLERLSRTVGPLFVFPLSMFRDIAGASSLDLRLVLSVDLCDNRELKIHCNTVHEAIQYLIHDEMVNNASRSRHCRRSSHAGEPRRPSICPADQHRPNRNSRFLTDANISTLGTKILGLFFSWTQDIVHLLCGSLRVVRKAKMGIR
jgi:hypothetical protein